VAQSKPSSKKRKFNELTNYKTLDENKAPIDKEDVPENEAKRIREIKTIVKRELPAFLRNIQPQSEKKAPQEILKSSEKPRGSVQKTLNF
jgi:hypothetical protein